jgi:hypothetical protein
MRQWIGKLAPLLAAAVIVAGGLVTGVSNASAAMPTQQFQSVYGGYNPWVSWVSWVPQPQCTESSRSMAVSRLAAANIPFLSMCTAPTPT